MLGFMVRRKVIVTQEEIDDYIARNKAELITDSILDLQVLIVDGAEEAGTLRAAIQRGELTFSDAVARYSQGPKLSDGVLETVRLRDLAGPWRDGSRGLAVGEMSEPFPVQDKWAVLKVLSRTDEDPRGADLVEEEVREAIMRPKMEERFKEYMTDLRARALIEKRL
jgi:peptidyl-prolyl cis-trans isomerase SurA